MGVLRLYPCRGESDITWQDRICVHEWRGSHKLEEFDDEGGDIQQL